MWYIAGLIRSSALYFAILCILNGGNFGAIIFYLALLLIHIGISKITKDPRDAGEISTDALVHDAVAPFLNAVTMLKKLLARQKSSLPAIVEIGQTYLGGIWGVLVIVILASSLL